MILIEIILSLFALATSVPVSVLFVQVLVALPAYRERATPTGRRSSAAVVVPAHNEASGIADTLAAIVKQLAAGDRLLVVADNCTDNTAAVAVESGAEVIERKDDERRGKGYALDFGIRFLESNPPEVVIIVDADCRVGAETIDRLARVCGIAARPVQALNLMHFREGAGLYTRLAEFAWLVKNMVRPLGFQRLKLPCQLMGTGMAFPWSVIATAPIASGNIVEDMVLGIDLTRSGAPPLFCPEAQVKSFFPITAEGTQSQRTRWEHGHLGVIFRDAPRLFHEAIADRNWQLLALMLDLCVPPLALMTLLVLAAFTGSAMFFATTGVAGPFWIAAAAMALLGSSVLLSWYRYGQKVIPLSGFLHVPLYALAKVPLYAKFLSNRQVAWVRSRRDEQ